MCPPHFMPRLGYRRVTRKVIRLRRIHAFAAERFADAQTPGAVRFWRAVMSACVADETTMEPIPGFFETMAERHRRWR